MWKEKVVGRPSLAAIPRLVKFWMAGTEARPTDP